jgi:predicted nucleic acid-binding protein
VVKAPRSLLAGLGEHSVVVVDTAPIIYWLEEHPRLAERFAAVFETVESGEATAVISTVTLAEVLAGPLRSGNELLTAQYRETLTRSPGWRAMPFDMVGKCRST